MPRWILPTEVNMSNPENLIAYPNTATNGLALVWLAVAVYVITLISIISSKKDVPLGFALAGFSTFAVMVWFWLAGYFNSFYMGTVLAMAIIGFVVLWLDRKNNY